MTDALLKEGREMASDPWTKHAKTLIGPKPAELEQWAHDAKIQLIAASLRAAYQTGVQDGKAAIDIERGRQHGQ